MNNVTKLDGRKIALNGEEMTILIQSYGNSGRPRIDVVTPDEQFGTLTVNDKDIPLAENEVLVKTWSENEFWYEAMYATGWFEDTGRRIPMGYCEASVWRVL